MPMRRVRAALVLLALLPAGGCAVLGGGGPASLPEPLPRLEVEAILAQRARPISTLRDTDVSLVMESGPPEDRAESPTLGGIMALDLELPGLWLRAEKMGQKVFSLRVKGDSFWLKIPDTREVVVGTEASFDRLPYLVRPTEVAAFLGSPDEMGITWPDTRMRVEPDHYRFDVHVRGRIARRIYVSRASVEIRRIVEYDPEGRACTEVHMEEYSEADGMLVPFRVSVERPLSGWKVTIRLSEPKLNREIDRRFFEPGGRAGHRYIDLDRQPLSDVEAFRPRE